MTTMTQKLLLRQLLRVSFPRDGLSNSTDSCNQFHKLGKSTDSDVGSDGDSVHENELGGHGQSSKQHRKESSEETVVD